MRFKLLDENLKLKSNNYLEEDGIYNTGKITCDNIFDTSSQELSYYEDFISNPNKEENKIFTIKQLSPREYFEECAKIFNSSVDKQLRQIKYDNKILNELKQVLKRGSQFPLTILDYPRKSQEGRHRMYVAGELYGWDKKFPVGIIRWEDEEKAKQKELENHQRYVLKNIEDDIENLSEWEYTNLEEFESEITDWMIPRWVDRYDYQCSFKDEGDNYLLTVEGLEFEFSKSDIKIKTDDLEDIDWGRFSMRFKVRLVEDIEYMKKYYPNIDDNTFMEYIKLDPTYKEGSKNPGTYAKWILALATRNKGELPNAGHIKDLLARFEESKNNLKDKNISRFKSAEELEDYLEDEDSYKDLSKRQQLRQTQKAVRNTDLDKDASLVYEDSDWEVWVPHTYEASCKLGRGSSWCTASTESDYYYNMYTNEGDLHIIINKHNPEEKYQLHTESSSFMDKDDRPVDLVEFFDGNEGLKSFFFDKLLKKVFGENVKENEPQYIQIDASKLSDSFSDQDYHFLVDPWEEVQDWGYENNYDPDYLYPLNDKSQEVLKKLTGLTEDEAQDILKNYEDDNPYYDALDQAYSEASYQASIAGASKDVYDAVQYSLDETIKEYGTLEKIVDGILTIKIIPKDFIDILWNDYEVDFSDLSSPKDILIDYIDHEYRRRDPYDEYSSSWDADTFDEVFQEVLSDRV